MACIVYHTDKKSGSTYAFRSESYRDPVTRKPRNRREYLGRVDPETGEIIPKRPRGPRADRAKASGAANAGAGAGADRAPWPAEALARVGELEGEVSALRAERDSLRRALEGVRSGMRSLSEGVEAALG